MAGHTQAPLKISGLKPNGGAAIVKLCEGMCKYNAGRYCFVTVDNDFVTFLVLHPPYFVGMEHHNQE
jgi:hypothetical protein